MLSVQEYIKLNNGVQMKSEPSGNKLSVTNESENSIKPVGLLQVSKRIEEYQQKNMPNWNNDWPTLLTGLCILLFVLILTGCATSMPPSSGRIKLDTSLTEPCPSLTPLTGMTGRDLTNKLVEVGKTYNDCRDKHKRLVEAVK